jgi:peptidyl-prolyl cis-trans isomerase B (cyclophilin B)
MRTIISAGFNSLVGAPFQARPGRGKIARRSALLQSMGLCLLMFTGGNLMAADTDEVAVIETKFGNIVIEFYEQDAPKTVANFKKLAREGFYNGTTFHRVIPGFMIQGGDPLSKDDDRTNDGTGGPGYTIEAEIKRPHKRGTVATARLPDSVNPEKRSSGSQFFINVKDNDFLNGNYTVFGNVIAGMDVADKIVAVPRDNRDNPREKVEMTKVFITTRAEALKK